MRTVTIILAAAVVASTLGCRAPTAFQRAHALSAEATPVVEEALQDGNWKLSASAAEELRARNDPSAIASLIRATREHPAPEARAYAAKALGRFRDDQVRAALLACANDPREGDVVREQAILALGEVGADKVALDLARIAAPDTVIGAHALATLRALLPKDGVDEQDMLIAISLATGKPGTEAAALRFWRALARSRPDVMTEQLREELQRLETAISVKNEESAKAFTKASAEAAAREASERRLREEVAEKRIAAKAEQERLGNEQLALASRALDAGRVPEAVDAMDRAESFGVETGPLRKRGAAIEWRQNGRSLSGDPLRGFVTVWGEASPAEATSRLEREDAVRERKEVAERNRIRAEEANRGGDLPHLISPGLEWKMSSTNATNAVSSEWSCEWRSGPRTRLLCETRQMNLALLLYFCGSASTLCGIEVVGDRTGQELSALQFQVSQLLGVPDCVRGCIWPTSSAHGYAMGSPDDAMSRRTGTDAWQLVLLPTGKERLEALRMIQKR